MLLHVKYTVKEFDCELSRDIVELIQREEDLIRRGRKAASLRGEFRDCFERSNIVFVCKFAKPKNCIEYCWVQWTRYFINASLSFRIFCITALPTGLRKRLSNLFLEFVKTPQFNPEAANFAKVPVEIAAQG